MRMLQKIGKPVSLSGALSDLSAGLNIAVTFDDAYQSVLENALPILQARNIPAAVFVPSGCLGMKPSWITNPGHIYADETVMTKEQIKSLPHDLITIGSHTVSHINLNTADEDTIRREAVDSKTALESVLNRKVVLFAAPYAIMDEKYADILIRAGYMRAFLNIPSYPVTKTDLFILGRNSVEPTDWPIEFYLKLSGAYQWLPLAINLKKKFTH
jgi:peptidoglycan/xylan/chitin deacetylase (PgdA/CDA1 family)